MISQIKHYLRLIRPFWTSRQSCTAWIYLIGGFCFNLSIVYFSLRLNQLTGDFYNFIEAKDGTKIGGKLVEISLTILGFMAIFSLQLLLTSLANFKWREWLTKHLLARWFAQKAYYFKNKEIDNPDQRLSDDVHAFCDNTTSLFFMLAYQMTSLGSFFLVLWNFGTPLRFSIGSQSIVIPHYLALFSLLYALGINLLIFKIGRPLVKLNYQQEKREADFRYSLFRVREFGEEVALSRGEDFERGYLEAKFSLIKKNYFHLLRRRFYLNLSEQAHMSLISILPTIFSLPLLLSGDLSLGGMMQIGNAFSYVLMALCSLVMTYQGFASLQAIKNRLYPFLEMTQQPQMQSSDTLRYENQSASGIMLSKLALLTPNKEPLIAPVDIQIQPGERLLLMGKSGLGKSSLIRTLAGLWPHAEGEILLSQENLFILPQKSYFPIATLRECLFYPRNIELSEESLKEVLIDVGLAQLIDDLDREDDWMRRLSLGEQQRLNFARVFIAKPKILVMDEPTSSLDKAKEREMFERLIKRLGREATLLTVSHSEGLKELHDRCITLESLTLASLLEQKLPVEN